MNYDKYPDIILVKQNDIIINILKQQGLSTYYYNPNELFVLYSQNAEICIGDIILINDSYFSRDVSLITYIKEDILCKTIIGTIQIKCNSYIKLQDNIRINLPNFNNQILKNICGIYNNIVIDIRTNSGGKIDEMIQFCGNFLKKESYLFSIRDLKTGKINHLENQNIQQIFFNTLLILCDYTTFSSAEIFIKILRRQPNVKICGKPPGKEYIYNRTQVDKNTYIDEKRYYIFDKTISDI